MFSLSSLLFLALLACVVLVLFESLRIREAVTHMCSDLCEKSGMQLLDQTVSLAWLAPRRSVSGNLYLQRVYQFEVSNQGTDRYKGYITLAGRQVEAVQIDSPDGMTTIYPVTTGRLQ